MKKIFFIFVAFALTATANAGDNYYWGSYKNNPQYQKDSYGRYTKQNNLYKDTDGDGVINYYDRNDRNPNVTTQPKSNSNGFYDNSYGNSYGNQGYGGYGYGNRLRRGY